MEALQIAPLKVAFASVPERRVMLYAGEMRIRLRKDRLDQPARPGGQRGVIKADTRPDELESRSRTQDNYERSSLTDDGVQAFRDRQRLIVGRRPLSLGAAPLGATLAWTISQRAHSAASRDDE